MNTILLKKIGIVSKYTLLILIVHCMSCAVLVAHKSAAQKVDEVHLSVEWDNVALKEALKTLELKTDFEFFFDDKKAARVTDISLVAENKSLKEILLLLSREKGLRFKRLNRVISVIKQPKGGRLPEIVEEDYRVVEIGGKITDENGEGLPGASVIEKGTVNGTTTDVEGNYKLSVSENATLVISFVGYQTVEISTNGRSVIDVEMVLDAEQLEEVVVVGYGTVKKSDLTGAVSNVKMENTSVSSNVTLGQYLQGVAPGLNVGQVDEAGENPSLSIRGQTTLNGNQSVLIVVDGIIFNGSLSELNPADIASVNVLKDASSKAIYGAQAANGVILIDTKQGDLGQKPVVRYSTSFSVQNPTNKLEPYDNAGWVEKNTKILWRDAYTEESGYLQPNPNFDYAASFNPFNLSTELAEYIDQGIEFNWFDELTDPGKIIKHDLSVSGSTANTRYLLSIGYVDQDGYLFKDDFNRVTGRINLESEINDWFTFGANTYMSLADYSGEKQDFPSRLTNHFPAYDENGEMIPRWGVIVSPLTALSTPDFDKRNSVFGKVYAKIRIPSIKGLMYTINYGNNYRWNRHYNANKHSGSGVAFKNNEAWYDWTLDNILNYKTTLNEDHNIDVTLLYGARENKSEKTASRATGFANLLLGYNSLQQGENLSVNSDAWEESFLYQMARLNYNYKNRYYFTATYRRDGYSGFSKNNKIGEFPSMALRWAVGDEPFLSNLSFMDQLDLRVGYGSNGNLVARYSSLGLVSSGPTYVVGAASLIGQAPSSLANNDLLWEKTSELNVGVDFSVYNGVVSGTFNYYTGTTNDLLFDVDLPSTTGFTRIKTNVGEIANRGFESLINVRAVSVSDFSWNVGLVFSTNKNEVVKLPGSDNNGNGKVDINTGSRGSSFLEEGLSIGSIQNFEWDGFWQISDFESGTISNAQIGSEKVIDRDEVDGIDENDVVIVGRTEPAYRFSIRNDFRYKKIGLSFFINSIQGGKDGYLGNNTYNPLTLGHALSENMYKQVDFWTPSNTNPDWRSPSSTQVVPGFAQYNSRSFVRLQDVSLTYNFDSAITDKLGIGSLSVFVSGKNLITLTDWKGWDPETGAGLNGSRPVMKSYSIGLDVSF